MPPAPPPASLTLPGLLFAALLALAACGAPQAGVPGSAISVSVCEAGLGGGQPAAARHPADIAGPACAAAHSGMIEEARQVAERLHRTAALLGQPHSVKILCDDPPACRGPRMAYAAPGRCIIGLCPAFFRARMQGYDSRWGVLVHEASHLAAGTDDFAYCPAAALIRAKQDPVRAARNADTYEYFVETLHR
jgi:hypothetical protein